MTRGFLAEVLHAVISPFFRGRISGKNMQVIMVFAFVISYSMQQSGKFILASRGMEVPAFLDGDKTMCQQQGSGQGTLRCGNSGISIKPECVCTFYNVNEAKYHDHTACPNGENSDDVKRLTCRECIKFSLNNKGPCINGGNLTCKTGDDMLAPDIQCDCPPHYGGMFCENRMEKVTRICDRTGNQPSHLKNCNRTKMDCITYSESKRYAFKCNKTEENQERKGLPLCNETEVFVSNAMSETTSESGPLLDGSNNRKDQYVSGADRLTSVLTLISMFCQVFNMTRYS